jgi:hypothetical protein
MANSEQRTAAGEKWQNQRPSFRTRDIDGGQSVARGATTMGADDEIRTRDIDLGKVALYQLSYIRRPAL